MGSYSGTFPFYVGCKNPTMWGSDLRDHRMFKNEDGTDDSADIALMSLRPIIKRVTYKWKITLLLSQMGSYTRKVQFGAG